MKMEDMETGTRWMTDEELVLSRNLVQGIFDVLCVRGVNENALLSLRIDEVVVTWLLARRLEDTFAPDEEGNVRMTASQVESVGKCRERLRKAVKELEEYCARSGSSEEMGLAERVQPVVRCVQGGNPFLA